MKIEVPLDEWEDVARRVAPFLGEDELTSIGHVVLISDGRVRTWIATDSYTLAALTGGPDPWEYEVLLPERVFSAATNFGRATREPVLVTIGGDGAIDLECSGVHLHLPAPEPDGARFLNLYREELKTERVCATIDRDELAAAVGTARLAPRSALDDNRMPLFHLSVSTDAVGLTVDWDEFGYTGLTVPARGTGEAWAAVNPSLLAKLIAGVDGDEFQLAVPPTPHSSLAIYDGEWTGLLMPIDTTPEVLRPGIEETLSSVFGRDVVHRDDDGDYRLSTSGIPVYCRLVSGSPAVLQVFAVAITDIDLSPDLLRELNDQNARTQFARLFVLEGQLLVEADLVAATLDPMEIATGFNRVRDIATEMGPLLAIAHGGEVTAESDLVRLDSYLYALLSAELTPEVATFLTGPDAIADWPFDGPVHVISAANPQGRRLPDSENDAALGQLAARLASLDLGFRRALGSSPDGRHVERGVLVWGLSAEDAIGLGTEFGQEAVFEIDEFELRVLPCAGGESLRRPRLSAGPEARPR